MRGQPLLVVVLLSLALSQVGSSQPKSPVRRDLRVFPAEVWQLPMGAEPWGVLPADDLLCVTFRRIQGAVLLDQDHTVKARVGTPAPVVAAVFDPVGKQVILATRTRPALYRWPLNTKRLSAGVRAPHAYRWLTVAGRHLYGSCYGAAQIDVMDLASLKAVGHVPVSGRPLRSALVGDSLYVTSLSPRSWAPHGPTSAKIDLVDLSTLRVRKTITVPVDQPSSDSGLFEPSAMVWDGSRFLYVAGFQCKLMVRVDTKTETLDKGFRAAVPQFPRDIVVDRDRDLVFVSSSDMQNVLSVISARDGKGLAEVQAGDGLMAADRDAGGKLWRLFVPAGTNCTIMVIDPSVFLPEK